MKTFRFWFVVPAAGFGSRMESITPKQFIKLKDHTILWYTLAKLNQAPSISGGVVALSKGEYLDSETYQFSKTVLACLGGETRSESVFCALSELLKFADAQDWVLVHDAARPLISSELIEKMIAYFKEDEVGGILALPVVDTVKQVDKQGNIIQTLERKQIWLAQTPQMFRLQTLIQALAFCKTHEIEVTDESSAIEAFGLTPKILKGDINNFKITFPEDLKRAELLLD